jgi:hypothetical protein
MNKDQFSEFHRRLDVELRAGDRSRLLDWLARQLPQLVGPSITSFEPLSGSPGTMVTIHGHQFSPTREENLVEVGGQSAFVVSATPTELRVITDLQVTDGPVKLKVGSKAGQGPVDFHVRGYPDAEAGEDGPPISFAGEGEGLQGDVNPIGTVRVLVALVHPSDQTPTPADRTAVVDAWNKVITFYEQASYGRTSVQFDVMTNWRELDGTQGAFLGGTDNILTTQLDRLTAQAAQGAVDEGFDLDDYAMMAVVCRLDTFIRAWGGWSLQNFNYTNAAASPPININITADHEVNLVAISQSASWDRFAHEFGHNVVSAPTFAGDGTATLSEDIYGVDLVDPGAATAEAFDMMGNHDTQALFSGYHMEKLGYYEAANIATVNWDGNPFSQEFDVAAHGLAEDGTARVHLVKIKVADGLHYYVQVRQRPGPTAQIFDSNIPLGGAPNQGGVIVTRVIADTLNVNQQTRFITLLHPAEVLTLDEFVDDPARALRITVVDDAVQARPLVCRVRVEWAQTVVDDPDGSFDLRVEPWDASYQTPDIWVDRAPFGAFDQGSDSEGRPRGNGDRPRPGELNRIKGRVHVSGAMGASVVKATCYAVFPPGVGDNGNWAPLGTQTIASISQNGFADIEQNWVPVLGRHTCLKLYASAQPGEISGGNNGAQENVFDFEAAANSPATPVTIPTAVRNPLEQRALVRVGVKNVPRGYRVHFPHAWVWLDPKAEKSLELTVIPLHDHTLYLGSSDQGRKYPATAQVRLEGLLARSYDTPMEHSAEPPGSRFFPIGGLLGRVHVRQKVDLRLELMRVGHEPERAREIAVMGGIKPAFEKQRVRVVCTDPNGRLRVLQVFTAPDGTFRAVFDLAFEPSLESDRRLWRKATQRVPGAYRVQAFVVAATRAAETASNDVYATIE